MKAIFHAACVWLAIAASLLACRSDEPTPVTELTKAGPYQAPFITQHRPWVGVHVPLNGPDDVESLIGELPALADIGVNLLITEINYNFEFASHPELRSERAIPAADIKKLAAACRDHEIRLVPQFQCLGHQSWGRKTHPLLAVYPQFDETPGRYPANKGIYARSWCPFHPDVNKLVFSLFDELLNAFEADALHVGLDEAFIVASDYCPRCRGKKPGEVFARAVNDFYDHIVTKRSKTMLPDWAPPEGLIPPSVEKSFMAEPLECDLAAELR